MKKILFLSLLLMTCGLSTAYAQFIYGVQVSWLEPTLGTGYIRSGTPSIQLHYVTRQPDRTSRIELFLGAAQWKNRVDSIPVYEVHTRNGSTFLADGYMKHQFFPSVFLGTTYTKRFSRDDLTGFFSCDLRLNFDFYIQEIDIPQIRNSSDIFLPNLYGGILPKVGLSYILNDYFDFQIGVGPAFLMTRYYQFQTYWEPSVKVTFGI